MAKDYLKPVLGGNIIDASCGSGMFSRLFARSDLFSLVIALDYSENMLRQCYELLNQEENFPNKEFVLSPFASITVLRSWVTRCVIFFTLLSHIQETCSSPSRHC